MDILFKLTMVAFSAWDSVPTNTVELGVFKTYDECKAEIVRIKKEEHHKGHGYFCTGKEAERLNKLKEGE